uniref:DUF4760 domain-containing protein n=1 Tax=uncultured marine crenarchaeote E37-7F TaxID=907717 RepID=G9BAP9_9ARCH|nr:hypothetical protein E37-7F_22 [uncultured marine crenarchaeote E37-7F]
MIELNIETISIILACGSIIVGVASVVDKNRREIKTREANLFMQSRPNATKEGLKSLQEVMIRQDWTTWDEYKEKYSSKVNPEAAAEVVYITGVFQTWGVLVREKLIDPKLIYRTFPRAPIRYWERLKPYVMGVRELYGNPHEFDAFEWLDNKMKEMLKEEGKGELIKTFKERREI